MRPEMAPASSGLARRKIMPPRRPAKLPRPCLSDDFSELFFIRENRPIYPRVVIRRPEIEDFLRLSISDEFLHRLKLQVIHN